MRRFISYLKTLSFYVIAAVICALLNTEIIPDITGTSSTMYLFTLAAAAYMYVNHRATPRKSLKLTIQHLMLMGLMLLFLRGLKYSAFKETEILARHTWYMYYVPTLLMPLLLFRFTILTFSSEASMPRRYIWMAPLTLVLAAFVLTNDLHQLVFRFKPGFAEWDSNYSYGPVFYAVCTWQYLLYLLAAILLFVQCTIRSARKRVWEIFVPFLLGLAAMILSATGKMPKINGITTINFPEAYCVMSIGMLLSVIQTGLIPTNKWYGALFAKSSVSARITDFSGSTVYSSETAGAFTRDMTAAADGTRTGAHTILHKNEIPGGYGFWSEDVTEQDRINAELEEIKSRLSEETELIRIQNELKEKRARIEQRSILYDSIAARTERQRELTGSLMRQAAAAQDSQTRNRCRNRIILLGAYIKRIAYLMLQQNESRRISPGDLGLSASELLRYLNMSGVLTELFNTAESSISSESALVLFEAFEELLENNFDTLRGVLLNISEHNGQLIFKATIETAAVQLSAASVDRLNRAGIGITAETEDETLYISFRLPRGGEAE